MVLGSLTLPVRHGPLLLAIISPIFPFLSWDGPEIQEDRGDYEAPTVRESRAGPGPGNVLAHGAPQQSLAPV